MINLEEQLARNRQLTEELKQMTSERDYHQADAELIRHEDDVEFAILRAEIERLTNELDRYRTGPICDLASYCAKMNVDCALEVPDDHTLAMLRLATATVALAVADDEYGSGDGWPDAPIPDGPLETAQREFDTALSATRKFTHK